MANIKDLIKFVNEEVHSCVECADYRREGRELAKKFEPLLEYLHEQEALEEMKVATTNDRPTSEYVLAFEEKLGTPEEGLLHECMEVLNLARGHLQYYEALIKKE